MKIRKVEPKNWIFPSDSINLKLVFPKATFTLDKDWFRVTPVNSLYEQKKCKLYFTNQLFKTCWSFGVNGVLIYFLNI